MNYCPNCGYKLEPNTETCPNCGKESINNVSNTIAKAAVIFGYLSFYPFVIFGSIIGFILGVISLSREDKDSKIGKKGMLLSIGSFFFWITIVIILIGYILIYKGPE